MQSSILDRLSLLSLFLVIVLLPVFFLPFTLVPVEISKTFLLVTGLSAGLIFWALGRFFDGRILIPKSSVFVSAGGILAVYIVSSFLAGNPRVSLFGTMLDTGSFWFAVAVFVLMFLSAVLFRTAVRARILLFGLILSSVILVIFQTSYLFVPDALSLGVLAGRTGNLFGSWNALGLFAGFTALMVLLAGEFFPGGKFGKAVLCILLFLMLLFISAVNFYLVWILLGSFALIIFAYKASLSFRQKDEDPTTRYFPAVPFVVVIISILFLVSGRFVGGFLPTRLGIANTEINPSFGATLAVAKNVLKNDPFFGIGPNRFSEAWALYKPQPVNNTVFWDVPFETGWGLLPTFLATAGLFGLAAWCAYFVGFVSAGIRSSISTLRSGANRETVAFFVLALYLFAATFFYAAGPALFMLALACAGVFIGLAAGNTRREITLSFAQDQRKSFLSMLGLIILAAASVVLAFKYYERFASVSHLRRALVSSDMAQAEAHITRAVALNPSDAFLRTYSQIYIVKLDSLSRTASGDTARTQLQAALDKAVRSAELAVEYNPENYLNMRLLGAVYEAAGSLGAEGGYARAFQAYQKSAELNPLNPGLRLAMARVLLADGKPEEALPYAEAALALAPNDQGLSEYVRLLKERISNAPAASAADSS